MVRFYTSCIQHGSNILVRGIQDGRAFREKVPFRPSLFVRSRNKSKYSSLFGDNLEKIEFGSIGDAKEYIKNYSEVENFPIYGNTNFVYQFISEEFPGEPEFDITKIKLESLDIETTVEGGFPDIDNPTEQILLISMQNQVTNEVVTYGWKEVGDLTNDKINVPVQYIRCEDEYSMLKRFVTDWATDTPDIVTGWNIEKFDIPYLCNRIIRVLGEEFVKQLSPWRIVRPRSVKLGDKEITMFDIAGVSALDYLDLYKKFTYTAQESYRLDYIAQVELGRNKLENPYESFKDFYTKDWNLFVQYNIIDVNLVHELEDKMKLIELALTMAYDAKCNYNDVFSAVRLWDCVLYNHLLNKNIIVHQRDTSKRSRPIVGGYVKEPIPGRYDWIVSFDATSLYPSIIMQYNLSPETMVRSAGRRSDIQMMLNKEDHISDVVEKDLAVTANGFTYRRDKQGLFPEIVAKLFSDRKLYKNKMIDAQKLYEETKDPKYKNDIAKFNNFQMARKIQMNSLFGAWGNEYFRFYDADIAEGITMTGQYIIQVVGRTLNEYLNKVIGTTGYDYAFYSDTDSCYITLGPLVEKHYAKMPKEKIVQILDKICEEKIVEVINKACDEIADYTNAFDRKLSFKREAISDKGIWVAKKRYAANVYNNEGVQYAQPKLKVMGLEIVRSSTPGPIRDALKQAVKIAIEKDEKDLVRFVKGEKERYMKLKPEDIAFPRGVNGLDKYYSATSIYQKATPMHVRGSLLYNHYLDKHNLSKKYQKIQEGDKIKFLYLKEPNPIRENAISFIGELPAELQLTKYVDYDTMWEKSFVEPLQGIIDGMGWSTKERNTLEDLFI